MWKMNSDLNMHLENYQFLENWKKLDWLLPLENLSLKQNERVMTNHNYSIDGAGGTVIET